MGIFLLTHAQPATAAVDCTANSWSVGSGADLNAAIACYIAKTSSGTYTIHFSNGFPLPTSTTQIDNSGDGIELVILGSGFLG